jgi:DNA-binding SARP family transcriptional activator
MIRGRFRHFSRGLLALITLAAITVGLPIALYKVGGSPIPAKLPAWHLITTTLLHKDNGSLFIGAVRDVSWLAWLAFAIAVIAEAQAAIRGRQAPRLHLSVLQGMAGRLVAVTALTFSTPAAVGLAASSAMASTVQSIAPTAKPDAVAHATREAHVAVADRAIVVRPGDCLWTIAQHYLGKGDRYTQIVELNLGREMSSGQVFTDPALIQPGWRLLIPGLTHAGSGDGQVDRDHGTHHGASHHSATYHRGHTSVHRRFSRPHHAAGHPSHPASGGTQVPGGTDTTGSQSGRSEGGGTQAAGAGGQSGTAAARQHDQVAEAALFTLGMLAGAALASIDLLRHKQRQFRRPGRRIPLPADPAGRRVEQILRAAAARWPVDRTRSDDPDDWPEPRAPVDLRGPAGNRLPPNLDPFDSSDAYDERGSFDEQGEFDEPDEYSEAPAEADGWPPKADPVWRPDSVPGGYPADPADQRAAIPKTLREALRDLSQRIAVGGEPLPPIVGIHLTADTLDVLLSAPAAAPPPAPFVIAPARQAMCWTVQLAAVQPDAQALPPVPGEVGDLLPGLFTAGATEAGGYLLLDLEAMRVTCCDGPANLTDRMLVTAATELASSHWSGWYDLVLAGCDELDVLGRAELCRDLDEALELLETRAQAIERRMTDGGAADVRTRRLADPDDEDWGLTLLVSRLRPTPGQMSRLLDLADGPGGIAALVAGDTQTEDGKLAPALFQLDADSQTGGEIVATITLAYLGPDHHITVWPQTLTVPEYEALAGIFATAADTADVGPEAAPYGDFGAPPWIRLAAAPVTPSNGDSADDQFGSYQPPRAAARHAAPRLQVQVLGPVQILGSEQPLLPKQAELVLALALHAPGGVSNSGLCSLLGPDADHPRPSDSVRQLITRARKRLGQAPDGQEFIIHRGSGLYVPHRDLTLDWATFSSLARRGRADRRREDLRAAMALVRGEPFADCYHWWIDVGLIETIRAEIIDTAEFLAQLELAAGDSQAAAAAAKAGLAAESAAEQLWRALMRAEFKVGNHEGVNAAWTGCLDAITEIAPGGEPHPDTEQLFHELTRGAPIGSYR